MQGNKSIIENIDALRSEANSQIRETPQNATTKRTKTCGCIKLYQSILWEKPFLELYCEPRLTLLAVALLSASERGYWTRGGRNFPCGCLLATCEELATPIPIGALRIEEALEQLTKRQCIKDYGTRISQGKRYKQVQVIESNKSLVVQGSETAKSLWSEETTPYLLIDRRILNEGETFRELNTEELNNNGVAKLRSLLVGLSLVAVSPRTIPLEVAEVSLRATTQGFVITRREISRLAGADITANKGGDIDKYLFQLQEMELLTILNYEEIEGAGYYTLDIPTDWSTPKQDIDELGAKPQEGVFIPPTIEEAQRFCEQNGLPRNVEAWLVYYATRGWKTAKGEPITDWQASLRKWRDRQAS